MNSTVWLENFVVHKVDLVHELFIHWMEDLIHFFYNMKLKFVCLGSKITFLNVKSYLTVAKP